MFLIELLVEVFGEALFQLLWEGIVELLSRFFDSHRPAPKRPLPAAVCLLLYAVFGIGVGWLSTLLVPVPLFKSPVLPGFSMIASPVLTGYIMAYIGKKRPGSSNRRIHLDRFSIGFVFALGISVTRFLLLRH